MLFDFEFCENCGTEIATYFCDIFERATDEVGDLISSIGDLA